LNFSKFYANLDTLKRDEMLSTKCKFDLFDMRIEVFMRGNIVLININKENEIC